MPIFFHAESHLWIAYLFFFNGLLLSLSLRGFSSRFKDLTQPFEALFLSSFFLSISINAVILAIFDLTNRSFKLAWLPLLAVTATLLALIIWRHIKRVNKTVFVLDFAYLRFLLYAVVFIILFYNGGLIDQLTDAWWHMSMANKIGIASSYNPELGHLTGAPVRAYPPMWHANLALANVLSGLSIPMFWNSFTAWGAVLKVMAFYLFALGLTRNTKLALLAAFLFFMLPGVGNAYMRVSAWPSHIAYAALYCMFYVFAKCIDQLPSQQSSVVKLLPQTLRLISVELCFLVVLGVIVYFTHRAELLWFAVACWCYLAVGSISRSMASETDYLRYRDNLNLRLVYSSVTATLLAYSVWLFVKKGGYSELFNDVSVAYLLPILILTLLLLIEFKKLHKVSFVLLIALVLAAVNYTHLASLFYPELALPRGRFHESSLAVEGYFGQALNLPGWHLQLRGGLLYSGIIAIPLSLLMVFLKPAKEALFASGAAFVALLFCTSPYLYHWLQDVLGYHSPWRIMILNFHPLVIAICVFSLVKSLKRAS